MSNSLRKGFAYHQSFNIESLSVAIGKERTVTNGTCKGKVFILLILLVVLAQLPASGATIMVPDDFPNIQRAVERARPNDTIVIRRGVYHERVIITKPMTLLGAGESEPTKPGGSLLPSLEGCPLTGCSEPVIIAPFGGAAMEIRSDNVVLKGLRFEATDTCLILENVDRVSVDANIFGDCRTCIAGFDTVGTRIERNSFAQCRKTALQLTSSSDVTVTTNRLDGALNGIRGDGIARWHIMENHFQNLTVAANLNSMVDSIINNNTIVNCNLGYLVISSQNTTISDKLLENTAQYLFLLNSISTVVTVKSQWNVTTLSKDIDSSSSYHYDGVTITGSNYAFSLSPPMNIDEYRTKGSYIQITLLDTPGGKRANVKLEAEDDLQNWANADPFTFGFYLIEGKRPLFTSTTYVTGNLMRTSSSLGGSADGIYALMAKKRVTFGSTIEGIALVIVIIAAIVGFALHRKHLSRMKRELEERHERGQ